MAITRPVLFYGALWGINMTLSELKAKLADLEAEQAARTQRYTAETAHNKHHRDTLTVAIRGLQQEADRAAMVKRMAKWPPEVMAALRAPGLPRDPDVLVALARRGLAVRNDLRWIRASHSWTTDGNLARKIVADMPDDEGGQA